ncbi:nucleoside diphosphate kinase regulator [Rhodococcus sp. D2-41]|nr:nucleoside diphosphate kinase regulator [Rhodococcus sp. D2-41]
MNKRTQSTPAPDQGRERVLAELAELRDRRDRMLAERTNRDTFGDEADEADELGRVNALALLERRIAEVQRWLEVGGSVSRGSNALPHGTVVGVRFADGTVRDLHIVTLTDEISDADGDASVTAGSPLGRALFGHDAGDTVTYTTPSGPQQVEILSVKPPGENT